MNMKLFYLALVGIAAVGVAAIWGARRSINGAGATSVTSAALASVGEYEGFVLGSDSAPVEIVEFADFQCPACARFAILTASDVKARLVERGLARLRFHDFPLPNHGNAMPAHLAAACAGEQDEFWAMHDQLFYNQGRWSRESRPARRFREYARAIGLEMGQFDECMKSERQRARLEVAKAEATALGVGSTPSFLVGDVLVPGALPYDSLKVLVEKAAGAAAQ
jgi:protein-disulfide isomerase